MCVFQRIRPVNISRHLLAIFHEIGSDDDASFLVDEAQAQELQWYATQEIEALVAELLR